MRAKILQLTEEQIEKLPFPSTARAIGGILILEDDPLPNHLNLEEFRKQWNEAIKNSDFKVTKVVKEGKLP